MNELPDCPECKANYTYEDRGMLTCPSCGNEWSLDSPTNAENAAPTATKDANGNVLNDGDSVTVVKALKIKGSSAVVKIGTKVKDIRLIDRELNGDHDIDCKVKGIGAIKLKSEFVKKST